MIKCISVHPICSQVNYRQLHVEALLMLQNKTQRLSCGAALVGVGINQFCFPSFSPFVPPECWIGLELKQDLVGFWGTFGFNPELHRL